MKLKKYDHDHTLVNICLLLKCRNPTIKIYSKVSSYTYILLYARKRSSCKDYTSLKGIVMDNIDMDCMDMESTDKERTARNE